MRIGANSGSLPKHLADVAHRDQAEALVEAALERSACSRASTTTTSRSRSSRATCPTMIRAYRMLSERVPYPLTWA
jgi:(E)-4-hydroxy-3-methylbut-2-enyl-diphosphate synthase